MGCPAFKRWVFDLIETFLALLTLKTLSTKSLNVLFIWPRSSVMGVHLSTRLRCSRTDVLNTNESYRENKTDILTDWTPIRTFFSLLPTETFLISEQKCRKKGLRTSTDHCRNDESFHRRKAASQNPLIILLVFSRI